MRGFDVFVEDEVTDTAHIYEVKSSKFIGKDHKQKGKRDKREGFLYDLGFQVFAARESGIDVSKAFLVSVYGEYVRDGELDLEELLVFEDVTEEIETLQPLIEVHIGNAFKVLESKPEVDLENLCGNQLKCEFLRYAIEDFLGRTIKEIPAVSGKKYTGLLDQGILDIHDVPKDYDLTENQRGYVNMVQAGEIVFDSEAIQGWIDRLEYPLYFLDYESVNPAIPEFDGVKSYEQITFQYSLHIEETPESEVSHEEFLSDGVDSVSKSVAQHLSERIGEKGSIVVWSKSFEVGRNKDMARWFPEFAEFFEDLNSRMVDLRDIFSKRLYFDPTYAGDSIKSVLPKLVPGMSYDEMDIGGGALASARWFEDVYRGDDEEKKVATMKSLREYCKMDTLAMVRILEALDSLIE